jgi:hypothetical protein
MAAVANQSALGSDGTIWAWGDNTDDRLAVNADGGYATVPLIVPLSSGAAPTLAVTAGANQSTSYGSFAAGPLTITVTSNGVAVSNALVNFIVESGGGLLSASTSGSPLSAIIQLQTNSSGQASAYFQEGATGVGSQIVATNASTQSSPFNVDVPLGTEVRIVGSTAYRANTHEAILNYLGAGAIYAYDSTQGLGFSSHAIFCKSDGSVVVKTSWFGSARGIQDIAQTFSETFYADSVAASGRTTGAYAAFAAGTNSESVVPDAAMSDVFQSSTSFRTPTLLEANGGPVGIAPFVPVACNGVPSSFTNLDNRKALLTYEAGGTPLAVFTGNYDDEGAQVFPTGGDPNSGIRLNFLAESGIGLHSGIQQYQPVAGTGGVLASAALYPQQTVNGIIFPVGIGGESSGGAVAQNLRLQGGANVDLGFGDGPMPTYFLSYLGLNDLVTTALSTSTGSGFSQVNYGPAVQLSWNGASISAPASLVDAYGVARLSDNSPITEGAYTFWSTRAATRTRPSSTTSASRFRATVGASTVRPRSESTRCRLTGRVTAR